MPSLASPSMCGVLTPALPVKLKGEPRSSAITQTMFGLRGIPVVPPISVSVMVVLVPLVCGGISQVSLFDGGRRCPLTWQRRSWIGRLPEQPDHQVTLLGLRGDLDVGPVGGERVDERLVA